MRWRPEEFIGWNETSDASMVYRMKKRMMKGRNEGKMEGRGRKGNEMR